VTLPWCHDKRRPLATSLGRIAGFSTGLQNGGHAGPPTCHCEERSDEAIPFVTSRFVPARPGFGIASSGVTVFLPAPIFECKNAALSSPESIHRRLTRHRPRKPGCKRASGRDDSGGSKNCRARRFAPIKKLPPPLWAWAAKRTKVGGGGKLMLFHPAAGRPPGRWQLALTRGRAGVSAISWPYISCSRVPSSRLPPGSP
jgi:hypothetical protein